MKPEKAISIINDYDVYFEGHTAEEIVEAMELAIEALQKQIPKPVEETHVLRTETHACDLISRQESNDTIKRSDAIKALDNAWINGTSLLDADEAVKQLKDLPSAEPKTGECRTCARNADNGGYYEPEHRTRCPIQEHYVLLLDGFCHLYEHWKGGE